MRAVVLAAGKGSRLGRSHPKCLTEIAPGRTVLGLIVESLESLLGRQEITVVVGYKRERIQEVFPDLRYVYNDRFETTNTAKSLLAALGEVGDGDVLWVNGDVVAERGVYEAVVRCPATCMAVRHGAVGDEEVKFVLGADGCISRVSKEVSKGLGEAVGVNKVLASDLPALVDSLGRCQDTDYFEKGIEYAIAGGTRVVPVDVTGYRCEEIDFPTDLARVQAWFDPTA